MDRLVIVMYHYIRDLTHSRYPGIKGLDIKTFREQIDFLRGHFNIITMEELILVIKERGGVEQLTQKCSVIDIR